jgi:hypothetical protein
MTNFYYKRNYSLYDSGAGCKVLGIVGDQSFSIVLPKSYAINLGIGNGDLVKVSLVSDKITVEKVNKNDY